MCLRLNVNPRIQMFYKYSTEPTHFMNVSCVNVYLSLKIGVKVYSNEFLWINV